MPDIESAPAAAHLTADKPAVFESRYTGSIDGTPTRPPEHTTTDDHTGRRPPRNDPIAATARRSLSHREEAYHPSRSVTIGGQVIDADVEIEVYAPEMGYPNAEVLVYNLGTRTSTRIDRSDRVLIELGWDHELQPVFDGEVLIKRRLQEHGDRAFVFRCKDLRASIFDEPYVRTYRNLSPHRIAGRIATEIEPIGAGYISTTSNPIEGHYSLSSSKSLSGWLDALVQKAADQTDTDWVWYLDRGELFFHPRRAMTSEPVTISADESLQRISPAGATDWAFAEQGIEVVAYCEPTIRRGSVIQIEDFDPLEPDERFRVESTVHESKSTGAHRTTFTANPLYEEARVPEARA